MSDRSVEDHLRQEYFDLLPEIRRVAEQLETEVRHSLLPISLKLDKHEQVIVTRRIKECTSAIDSLRRRQEAGTFQTDPPKDYRLRSLPDLAGVRVVAFPRSRVTEIDRELRKRFPKWESDPVLSDEKHAEPLAFKYHGYCEEASGEVRGELQIMSLLTARFWEVEHSTVYKPAPALERVARSREMRRYTNDVLRALRVFEEEFERLIRLDPATGDKKQP